MNCINDGRHLTFLRIFVYLFLKSTVFEAMGSFGTVL